MDRIYLNDGWEFQKAGESAWTSVRLPHTNIQTPLHYFDEQCYQFESVYQTRLTVDPSWQGKYVFITFEAVAHKARVTLNGNFVGEHLGGYTAFCFDLAPFLRWQGENLLQVEVDSRESLNLPPFGNVVDYLTYGGIYREVTLQIKEQTHLHDLFVHTDDALVHIDLTLSQPAPSNAVVSIRKLGQSAWQTVTTVTLSQQTHSITHSTQGMERWTLERPTLYQCKVELQTIEGKLLDQTTVQFGFRTAKFCPDGFYLNGQKVKLRGLNRHQSYPYVGYAMPKRAQQLDADVLKQELGVNAVRTSHYPQSQHFIDRCDEIGLLVFTEIPGWQHIGDDAWQQVACIQAQEMVTQYRNHPSIVLWGARINESPDQDNLYRQTNHLIHVLDPSRQTGGVRCIKHSHLLEDVYTYNDFSHMGDNAGLEPKRAVTRQKHAPYLVSEYNGHMFPTKSFDSEAHRLSHAKRHAKTLDALYQHDDITAGFGWCMFDYHTHKDFGSGDHICYHGVLNAFRVPKLAAAVYASQADQPAVLEISSTMDIGEHPACNLGQVVAYTNADEVRLYKNNTFIKSFTPDRKSYPHLPHPPILIDDFIGDLLTTEQGYRPQNAKVIKRVLTALVQYGQHRLPLRYKLQMAVVMLAERLTMADGARLYAEYVANWGQKATVYRFDAVKQGQIVGSVKKTSATHPHIQATADTTTLCETHGYDVATVRIQIVDEQGKALPYYQGGLSLETSGAIALIGPDCITATGGTGCYLKTIGQTGEGKLIIRADGLQTVTIAFTIIR